ncbi:hypothetical protein [Anaerotignum lactatifermentans]|uniref:hypothetical protein n=1 Tax=Anaerotignum lactatifermentans TaxID=160404 RepID=UPI00255CFDD1|nr:hypothetical protein [Anaerotignum lactatifermentans]
MEISSFLKMWMDVWNEAEEKGLKMPEEAILFRGKETENGEGMKEIIKFLPKRDFLAENGKTTVDALEKAVSQRNLMTILEKGQNAGENISFIEERKKKIAANMEVIRKRIQESRLGKEEESFWMAQTERPMKMPEEMAGTGMEKMGETLLSPIFAADGTEGEILRLLRQWQKKESVPEASQQISISIGQVRESADVNQVMEALTAKLREAHLSGTRKARGG